MGGVGDAEKPTAVQTNGPGRGCCPACGRAGDVALYPVLTGPGHPGPRDFPLDSMHVELGFHCGACNSDWDIRFLPQITAGGRRRPVLEEAPKARGDERSSRSPAAPATSAASCGWPTSPSAGPTRRGLW
jgi:hypothetical protein